MAVIIGIDLGTTYSAVAIPESRVGEGFYSLREFPGFSIILDERKNRITPSVVAEDSNGGIVVGHSAKSRAGMSPAPIMFAKRWMGEDKTFQLHKQGTLKPVDASAHILRYLKALAEKRLGEPVEEAVITVPAYFSAKAKQMTLAAAEAAGLRVAQLAQEPVAAAIMYCANDPRDPLRVMTYDLGGGTFDIAILEKRDGTISASSILAFDGDRFLGGYDFDKLLAHWLLDQLNERGYDLQLDLTVPRDNEIFARLMVIAEQTKIDLSTRDMVPIVNSNTGIVDHRDAPVALDLEISREQFEAMIQRQVDYTISLCNRARLEKAKPAIDRFDEILMVGGSSRIPLIARRLQEEYGIVPRLVAPDLCVALGAAVIAGSSPRTMGCLRVGRIPDVIDLLNFEVSGSVVPSSGLPSVDGCSVELRALDGSFRAARQVGATGSFVFSGVPLAAGERTDFALSVTSPAAAPVGSHRFSVRQSADPAVRGLVEVDDNLNVLSKPIGVLWAEGVEIIAPERTPLPYAAVLPAVTSDTSGRIRTAIIEGTNPLGEIVLTGIPASLPVGSTVEVTVTIQKDFKIQVRAWVPAIAREGNVSIDIPARPMKTVAELRPELKGLTARAKDALSAAGPNALFGDAKAQRIQDRLADCEEMLKKEDADVAKVQNHMDEVESLMREIGTGWRPEPPKAVFDQVVSEAHDLHAKAKAAKPEIAKDGYDQQIEAIRAEGEKAYTAQNPAAWREAYEKMVKVCDRLTSLAEKPVIGDAAPQQDPVVLLLQCGKELEALEKSEKAKNKARFQEFEGQFKDLATRLQRIDPKSSNAMGEIRDWYFTGLNKLKEDLERPETDGVLTRGKTRN